MPLKRLLSRIWDFSITHPNVAPWTLIGGYTFACAISVNMILRLQRQVDLHAGKEHFWRARWEAACRAPMARGTSGSITEELERMRENRRFKVEEKMARTLLEYEDELENVMQSRGEIFLDPRL